MTHLDVENFENIELDEFDTLIIPSGYYGTLGNEKNLEKIKSWVSKGGMAASKIKVISWSQD